MLYTRRCRSTWSEVSTPIGKPTRTPRQRAKRQKRCGSICSATTYRVAKGIIIDSDGKESHFIDVIVHDRQFTPYIFNKDGNTYIPAESVYAVFEAKQEMTKAHIEYAGDKAASVRALKRTSAKIKHAGGHHRPVRLFQIHAGILTYTSAWNPAFGAPFRKAIEARTKEQRLNIGLAVWSGCFDIRYGNYKPKIAVYPKEQALAAFVMRILARLQTMGSVPAIDYNVYGRSLKAEIV
jgi:hypothetical protein